MLFRAFIVTGLTALVGLASLAGCGGCGGDDGFPIDATTIVVPGTATLAWTITDPSGHPITCAQIGANAVVLQLTGRKTAGVLASLACDQGSGKTQDLPPDTYDVSIELHGAKLTPVVVPDQLGVIVAPGRDTMLAAVTFKVDPNGGLALSFKAVPQLTTNCGQPPTGAGITTTTIALQHEVSGPCEPLTFTHTKGAVVLAPYTVNCGSPMVVGCIETDETLAAASVPSGAYTIHVIGKINGADCWQNNDALQALPQGKVLTQTLNLSHHAEICP
jgi:hypothetical protein